MMFFYGADVFHNPSSINPKGKIDRKSWHNIIHPVLLGRRDEFWGIRQTEIRKG